MAFLTKFLTNIVLTWISSEITTPVIFIGVVLIYIIVIEYIYSYILNVYIDRKL